MRAGDLPVLGLSLAKQPPQKDPAAEVGESGSETAVEEEPAPKRRRPWVRIVWITSSLLLAVVIAIQLGNFFGAPFPDRASVQEVLIKSGLKDAPVAPLFRAPDQIELVSREMKPHPSRPGVLLLNATLVNRAPRQQAYPDIDISLLDARGQRLSRQLFSPGDYLKHSAELRTGMPPEAYLGIEIEIIDPGDNATGFELQFR